jgi:hypothetical protein
MTVRALLNKFRLRSVQVGEGERPVGNVDGMANLVSGNTGHDGGHLPVAAPPNWVPSQQDWGRPKH